jgi:quercetin dioxygenase-like cupin family protein
MIARPIAFLSLMVALAYAASALSPENRVVRNSLDANPAPAGAAPRFADIQTTVILGDPTKPGPYTIRLSVPPNTRIQAHTHRDNRTAVVVAGTWYFGYGPVASAAAEKALPAGSFYTEPAGVAHFAETKAEPAQVYITGEGPTDTLDADASDAP